MKKLQSLVLLFLTITLSSCFQNNFNTEGLVGDLKVESINKRSCLEIPFYQVIEENRANEILIDSIKIRVQSYDFFEMQSKRVNGYYYQRIDITGITNQEKTYRAIIEFKDCDSLYKEPNLDSNNNLIKIQYPKSSLNSILNMLENEYAVLLHYHNWEKTGKWAGLSYYKEK